MAPNTPEPREGASLGFVKKDDSSEVFLLFGGKNEDIYHRDTWELTLSPFTWTKISEDQNNVPNVVGSFLQQVKSDFKNRVLLVGGIDEQNESDNPTWERDLITDIWVKRTSEDKIESFDNTPDTVDWIGLSKIENSDLNTPYSLTFATMLGFDAGSQNQLLYYHPNTNKWRYASRSDGNQLINAYGSFVWVEWADNDLPCRMYILGGYDKQGNPLKLFQSIDLSFIDDKNLPNPTTIELMFYSNHTVIADEDSSLFTIDSSTPLFEGDPLVADGIANIRLANNPASRINTPNSEVTSSSCQTIFPLQVGVWDDELGWIEREDLDTHVILPFSTFAQVRLIELYIIKATGEIKVRVPLEDFGPHPELPQSRNNFSTVGISPDSKNRVEGILVFGGSMNQVTQNDLWTVTVENIGTSNQRFVWNRLS